MGAAWSNTPDDTVHGRLWRVGRQETLGWRMKRLNEKMPEDEWDIHLELSWLCGLGLEYIYETKIISAEAQLESSVEYVSLRLNSTVILINCQVFIFLRNFTWCYWILCMVEETSAERNDAHHWSWMTGNDVELIHAPAYACHFKQ